MKVDAFKSTLLLAMIITSMLGLVTSLSHAERASALSNGLTPNQIDIEDNNSIPLSIAATEKLDSTGTEPQLRKLSENIQREKNLSSHKEGWDNFAYIEDPAKLVIGVNADYAKVIDFIVGNGGKLVNIISMKGEVAALVADMPLNALPSFVTHVRASNLVRYIEPDMKVHIQLVPNDPYWSLQWGPQKIEADLAWDTTVGSPDVLVAVVDTGIDYNHPDLAANYVPFGYDWVNMDNDPMDDHGHGTHCAGITAAVLNNGIGIAGLAQVRVMAEKVLTSGGWGYWDWIANGIVHAADQGADIISMSFGGYGYSQLLHEAVKYAYDSGVLLVAAAGNEATSIKLYPAGFDEVIAVAATDNNDHTAWWSNWGDWIELAAPGVNIYSTVPWGYESWSGTSMAAPHVSGVAALVRSLYPEKSRDWVRLWLRYTANDLGDPGFDVYYGYGRINAKKAVEEAPPAHDLIAYEWVTPPYVEPGASEIIHATILNFGENGENDIVVQLLVDNTVVDSTLISFLASGDSTTVDLLWNPTVEGLYDVTLYVVPVPGETNVANNVLWKYIYVGFPIKAVVLHSAGNISGDIIANWQVLNSEWYRFGDNMIYIDYTTLNIEGITYENIVATEADVLIISCAYDPWMGWEFTDSEIEAIERYVHEGHGLIATAGTFYYRVPNNNKLAPLFGLNETITWYATGTDLLHLTDNSHPLFRNVPNPFVFADVGTAIPSDRRWDLNELVGGEYLASGHYRESAMVAFRGLVYISPWLEVIPSYYHHHLQLLYNAITWSRYQKPEHELVVYLEAPKFLKPSTSALLNATVYNRGLNDENNVELQLLIDNAMVDSVIIPELSVDSSYTLSHLWTPTVEGTYEVKAYAPPVPGEEYVLNNAKSAKVIVSVLLFALCKNVDPWDYPSDEEVLNLYGIPYVALRSSDFGRVDLSGFTKVVIVSDQNQAFYNAMDAYRWWFEDYVSNGGVLEIHAADWGWHGGGWIGPLPGGLGWARYYANYVTIVDYTHPVVTTPNPITDAELDGWNLSVHGYFHTYPADSRIVIIEDSTGQPVYLEFGYGTGSIVASSQTLEWAYKWKYSQILANSLLYMPVKPPFAVSVFISPKSQIGPPGATLEYPVAVKNVGTFEDTYYLAVSDTAGWPLTLSDNLLENVQPGENRAVTLSITIPEDALICMRDNITVAAISTENAEVGASDTCVAAVGYGKIIPPYEWTPRASTTDVANGDDVGTWIDLPFDFPFWGEPKTRVWVCSNGFLTFDPTSPATDYWNSLEGLKTRWMISPFWDDLTTDVAGGIVSDPGVYVDSYADKVVITWEVTRFGASNDSIKFQVILYSDGDIRINIDNATNFWNFSPTLGISRGDNVKYIDITDERAMEKSWYFERVRIRHGVDVSISPSYQSGPNGTTLNYTVTVVNTGNVEDTYSLTATDNAGWGLTISPSSLSLAAGTSGTATLTVTIPSSAENCTRDNVRVIATGTGVSAENSCIAHATAAPPPPPGIEWDALITATFSGGSDDAIFGVRLDATSGFDSKCDIPEPPAPPEPPYVRAYFYYSEQTPDELHRSCLPPENLMEWPLRIEYADNIENITLIWSVENIPSEYKVLLYRRGALVADMRAENNYTFEASAGSYDFRIVVGTIVPFTLKLTQGWNMISFPVLLENMSPDSIFRGYYVLYRWDAENKRYVLHADSGSFIEPDPDVEVGVGYWAYVLEDENVDLLGVPVNQLDLSLRQGWNLIGTPYGGSSIADPIDDPDNSVLPWAFTWNAEERSYKMTQLLEPGRGYLTYALRDCILELV